MAERKVGFWSSRSWSELAESGCCWLLTCPSATAGDEDAEVEEEEDDEASIECLGMIWTEAYSDLMLGSSESPDFRDPKWASEAGLGKVLNAATPPFWSVIWTAGRDEAGANNGGCGRVSEFRGWESVL